MAIRRLLALAGLIAAFVAFESTLFFDHPSRQKTAKGSDFTGSIPLTAPERNIDASDDIGLLKQGLDALSAGDIEDARSLLSSLKPSSLDRDILSWALAQRGGRNVSSAEIRSIRNALADWPGIDRLQANVERALLREKPAPQAALDALGTEDPQTTAGVIVLARAYEEMGRREDARRQLGAYWRVAKLGRSDEAAILSEFGSLISKADHRFRMERMLYADRISSAQRVAPYAQADALLAAWSAVIRRNSSARALLARVPANQRSAGYLFAEARFLRRSGDFVTAAKIVQSAPKDATELVDPDTWWIERRVLSRELLDIEEPQLAYEIAAGHSAQSAANIADAEFHAGWYALRALNDAAAARKHFSRILDVADGPISQARAYYWLGRATEETEVSSSRRYFEQAAVHVTTYYGQLAAEKLRKESIELNEPVPSDTELSTFSRRRPVAALQRLEEAGHFDLADRLYRALAAELDSPGELALLVRRAQQRGNHFLGLRIAKAAVNRGKDLGGLAHPVGVIPRSAAAEKSGTALAYAVARQESEFNPGAISGAGARGLLQLLPATAREVAQRNGLPYSKERLTSDPGYNATLGAAFLREQLDRFGGSYVLTLIGYNAGPRRAREWVERYGDPRGQDIDAVVDWIERIPYTETRNYVQRVMENYGVYKLRFDGQLEIAKDLVAGHG